MYRKRLLTAIVIMAMAAVLVGCGNSTAGVETVTEAQTQAVAKQEVTTQQATTAAPTQATTEATTQAETEAPTEAPTEAQTEAAVEVVQEAVAETPTEAATEAVTEAATQAASNSMYGKISDETADGYIIHDDWTVTTPIGTFSSVDTYNQATGHTEGNDPEHLTKGGYLYGDKKTAFLVANQNQTLKGSGYQHNIDNYGITDEDLAKYNITFIK
jgi:PBP1b-binding outer membrane lipoprotein LpoB